MAYPALWFTSEDDVIQHEIPFWLFWVTCLVVSCLSHLRTPNLLFTGLAEWEAEETLTLSKYSLATAKTLVCYQHHCVHKPETALFNQLWKKSTPSQIDPVHRPVPAHGVPVIPILELCSHKSHFLAASNAGHYFREFSWSWDIVKTAEEEKKGTS